MNVLRRNSQDGSKTFFIFDLGRGRGQRPSSGIFVYRHPASPAERNHNKQALALLEVKKSELILEQQAVGSGFIPTHKLKKNFLEFYEDFVKKNRKIGNRHLEGSLKHFRLFIKKDYLSPSEITENFSERFRSYLLKQFNGDTPANYFSRYKKVLKHATKQGYFRYSPAEDVAAKSNRNHKRKEHLETDEYLTLIKTPFYQTEIRDAFIFCCYTGLRYCDVKAMKWSNIKGRNLQISIVQEKTGEPLVLTLHPVANTILQKRSMAHSAVDTGAKVFKLPSNDRCNRALKEWCDFAGIKKHITWHCARLSFSVLLQDENVDAATVALLLGHTTTRYVLETYKRNRPKDQISAISLLPELQ